MVYHIANGFSFLSLRGALQACPCENRGSNLNPEITTLPAVTRNDISLFYSVSWLLSPVGTVYRALALLILFTFLACNRVIIFFSLSNH